MEKNIKEKILGALVRKKLVEEERLKNLLGDKRGNGGTDVFSHLKEDGQYDDLALLVARRP